MTWQDMAGSITPLGRVAGFVGMAVGLYVLVRRGRRRNIWRAYEDQTRATGVSRARAGAAEGEVAGHAVRAPGVERRGASGAVPRRFRAIGKGGPPV